MPIAKRTKPRGTCPECRENFPLTRKDRKFCSPRCANSDGNRYVRLGYSISRVAVAWRRTKPNSKAATEALNELIDIVDRFVDKEKERAVMSAKQT